MFVFKLSIITIRVLLIVFIMFSYIIFILYYIIMFKIINYTFVNNYRRNAIMIVDIIYIRVLFPIVQKRLNLFLSVGFIFILLVQ